MFHNSTQYANWLFKDVNELNELRLKGNQDHVQSRTETFEYLTADEERIFVLHYEYIIKQFCGRLQPPLSVVGTSIAYFKRFYLRNSVMDYHPRDIYLICVYLACKIEEFNISLSNFVAHVQTIEDREELGNILLSYELLLMEKLDFNLNVFNFYRPFEGLLLDLKARCPDIPNCDILRQTANEFLDKTLNTDASLLYPPSQIALTALVHSSSKKKIDIDGYCRSVLLKELSNDEVKQMLSIIKSINKLVREIPVLNLSEIKRIETKLNECYNRENDPRSQAFKDKLRKYLNEEDEDMFG